MLPLALLALGFGFYVLMSKNGAQRQAQQAALRNEWAQAMSLDSAEAQELYNALRTRNMPVLKKYQKALDRKPFPQLKALIRERIISSAPDHRWRPEGLQLPPSYPLPPKPQGWPEDWSWPPQRPLPPSPPAGWPANRPWPPIPLYKRP